MKKILIAIVAIFAVSVCSVQAQNQGKYGHVNTNEILMAMPGVDSIQIKLTAFQTELQEMLKTMADEFQTKKDKFDREAGTMSSSVRQIREKELIDLQQRIQEFQYGAQDDMEEKQLELLKPFQDKITDAIKAVAKEQGFAYIFDTQILLFYDNGIDATPMVKAKLGIKK